MTIDNIRAENPFDITNEVAQSVLRSINYSSSTNDQATVKDVGIKLNSKNDAVSLTDTSKIFNSEFSGKINAWLHHKDLEKPGKSWGGQ